MQQAVDALRTGFYYDEDFARAVEDFYGKYVATFQSDHHQVQAHLFENRGVLVAYLSFARGYDGGRATDRYLTPLKEFAQGKGFDGKLRLLYS